MAETEIIMGNVMDYLEWRGDLTFDQSPFNDVDNVILSQLAYVNFRDVIPSVQMNKRCTKASKKSGADKPVQGCNSV